MKGNRRQECNGEEGMRESEGRERVEKGGEWREKGVASLTLGMHAPGNNSYLATKLGAWTKLKPQTATGCKSLVCLLQRLVLMVKISSVLILITVIYGGHNQCQAFAKIRSSVKCGTD